MAPDEPREDNRAEVEALFDSASDEVRQVVGAVLRLERDHLHMSRPRVVDDIVGLIKQAVPE